MYTYLHSRVGKPGNEATLVIQVTDIEVRSSGYQARFSMSSIIIISSKELEGYCYA